MLLIWLPAEPAAEEEEVEAIAKPVSREASVEVLGFTSQSIQVIADTFAHTCRGATISGLLSWGQRKVADRWVDWTKDLVYQARYRGFIVFVTSFFPCESYDQHTRNVVNLTFGFARAAGGSSAIFVGYIEAPWILTQSIGPCVAPGRTCPEGL